MAAIWSDNQAEPGGDPASLEIEPVITKWQPLRQWHQRSLDLYLRDPARALLPVFEEAGPEDIPAADGQAQRYSLRSRLGLNEMDGA